MTYALHGIDVRTKDHWVVLALLCYLSERWQQHQFKPALETRTLRVQVKFNFIPFTLRPFSKDLFTHTVTTIVTVSTRHHQHHHSHENTMSEADSFDSPYFGIKLLFCYITLTTISFWNECAWIKFEFEHVLHAEIEFNEIKIQQNGKCFRWWKEREQAMRWSEWGREIEGKRKRETKRMAVGRSERKIRPTM